MSLNEYDPTNPLEGSIIDNADISYMSRIEIQGGGIIDSFNRTARRCADLTTDRLVRHAHWLPLARRTSSTRR